MKKLLTLFVIFFTFCPLIGQNSLYSLQKSILCPTSMAESEYLQIGMFASHALLGFNHSPKEGVINVVTPLKAKQNKYNVASKWYLNFDGTYRMQNIYQDFNLSADMAYKLSLKERNTFFSFSLGIGMGYHTIDYAILEKSNHSIDPAILAKIEGFTPSFPLSYKAGVYFQTPYLYASLYSAQLREELSLLLGFRTQKKETTKASVELSYATTYVYSQSRFTHDVQFWVKGKAIGIGLGWSSPSAYKAMTYISISNISIGYSYSLAQFDFYRSQHTLSLQYTLRPKKNEYGD